jgi:hypothetical protein
VLAAVRVWPASGAAVIHTIATPAAANLAHDAKEQYMLDLHLRTNLAVPGYFFWAAAFSSARAALRMPVIA